MLTDKSITYIAANIKLKGDANTGGDVIGYILGVLPINSTQPPDTAKNENYIWLFRENSVQIFSTKYYFPSTVHVGYTNKVTESRSFTVDKAKEGIEFISNIQENIKDANELTENGLIDVIKFTNVPEYLKKEIDTELPKTTTTTTTATTNANTSTHQIGYVRKEVSTTIIKRTTKYSITQAMESMKKKIDSLKAGEYVTPKLPEIPADKESKAEVGNNNTLYNEKKYGKFDHNYQHEKWRWY